MYTDDVKLSNWLQDQGFQCNIVDNFNFAYDIPYSFVIPTTYELQKYSNQLWKESFDSIIMLFSAVKFDNSLATIQYTLNHFFNFDIHEMLQNLDHGYNLIAQSRELTVNNNNEKLNIKLATTLETANHDKILRKNWQYSITELCEASVVNIKSDQSSFSCNGAFNFDGIIQTAANSQVKEINTNVTKNLFNAIHHATTKKIIIEDNKIITLILDDHDCTNLLHAMNYQLERGWQLRR